MADDGISSKTEPWHRAIDVAIRDHNPDALKELGISEPTISAIRQILAGGDRHGDVDEDKELDAYITTIGFEGSKEDRYAIMAAIGEMVVPVRRDANRPIAGATTYIEPQDSILADESLEDDSFVAGLGGGKGDSPSDSFVKRLKPLKPPSSGSGIDL